MCVSESASYFSIWEQVRLGGKKEYEKDTGLAVDIDF